MMKPLIHSLVRYLQENDSWVFLAVFFVLSAERAVNLEPHNWGHYISCLIAFTSLYFPVLLFSYFKRKLKRALPKGRFLFLWAACFIVWTGGVAWLMQYSLVPYLKYFGSQEYFIVMAFVLPGLDLGLEFNRYLNQKRSIFDWFKRIGIDGAILLAIALFSTLLGMMTVSNLDAFHHQELVIPSIDFRKVFTHFFLFLAYTLQFGLLYLSLYFFYLLNSKILIPVLLKKRGIFIYAIGVVGSIALFFPILAQLLVSLPLTQSANSLMPDGTLRVFTEQNALIPFIVIICSLPIIVALQWFWQNHEITQLEKQQVENELGLLKQQINPHFFFNTLNSLYSLSLSKSDRTPEVVVQLSELMRYVIYKGKEKEVLLTEEIEYLEDYIRLQKIRIHKDFELSFEKEIKAPDFLVPPLLLIILIENAFKHGIEPAEGPCFLDIHIKNDEDQITFTCDNSFDTTKEQKTGIGLDNLRRRLELLFPGRHHLITRKNEGVFTAYLKIWKP